MVRVTRRFLNEQQRRTYQQFLLTNPTDDQQLEYFRGVFENLPARDIFDLFRILNLREHPQRIQNFDLHRELRDRFEQQRQSINQISINMAAAVPQDEFIDDPYHGKINPGTKTGAQLYLKATASIAEEDKFDLNIVSAQKFLDLMTHDADAFGWGELVRSVNVGNNQTKDILIEHKMITLEQIKRQAHATWMNHDLANADQVPDT